jgi:hypothetical protein
MIMMVMAIIMVDETHLVLLGDGDGHDGNHVLHHVALAHRRRHVLVRRQVAKHLQAARPASASLALYDRGPCFLVTSTIVFVIVVIVCH